MAMASHPQTAGSCKLLKIHFACILNQTSTNAKPLQMKPLQQTKKTCVTAGLWMPCHRVSKRRPQCRFDQPRDFW